jgi:hypothetical protein
LGSPVWRKSTDIADADIEAELEKAMEILAAKNIFLDVIYPTDSRTLYQFLTEDLMEVESNTIVVPGMRQHFIYEEFRPNPEMDVRTRCAEFLKHYFKKRGKPSWVYYVGDALKEDQHLHNFRDAFDGFRKKKFKLTEIVIDGIHAKATFQASFLGIVGGEELRFEGPMTLELDGEYNWWEIKAVAFPPRV